ncbi:MAG: uroporphyrinogen decarboxylase [Armatimonadota bacterium]|nr:uroporphyrinogen decarboxylase [Armatimonadota bacterium]MDR5704333.1 uroporphyrinogen decarboxylase [Armatimonadota bacterium]
MNDRLLRACRREPVDYTPVWFMRQAGRYLPEYRALRKRYSFTELCAQPELAAQVALLPVDRLGVDGAIVFADLATPFGGLGVRYELQEGIGPVVQRPIRTEADLQTLKPFEPDGMVEAVLEEIRLLARSCPVPVIGFAGAPFTLACYLVEGGRTREYTRTKAMMYKAPAAWERLMELLGDAVTLYLRAQLAAGAHLVQLFDSWVGTLSPLDYATKVLPYLTRILAHCKETGAPVIYFGTGTAGLLPLLATMEVDVIGVDWRIALDDAWERIGDHHAIQGNLDPAVLLGPFEEVERNVRDILRRAGGRPGHIFNLGHGVLPETPVDHLRRLVELVHTSSPEGGNP